MKGRPKAALVGCPPLWDCSPQGRGGRLSPHLGAIVFELNPQKNDTSATLDLFRILASQIVCVGHAWNLLYEEGNAYHLAANANTTYLPYMGVMMFFVLSGFVIAYTLDTKSERAPDYGLGQYAVERFARIYSAYVPALALIATIDIIALWLGAPIDFSGDSFGLFMHNLFMLQGYPSDMGTTTFGTAGQLTSLAVEFHIYFLVGGAYFLFIGRNRVAALLLAIAFAKMPLAYFIEIPGSDRNLFVLWLLGFAGYFIARSIKVDGWLCMTAAVLCPILAAMWFEGRTPSLEYALSGYPVFALAFLALAVASQRSAITVSMPWLRSAINVAAGCSFSLFLIHYSLQKLLIYFSPAPKFVTFVAVVIIANVATYYFARLTENKHKAMALWILSRRLFLRGNFG
jgi:peptidoglycan/LPS O-acetylase OafA/YrhL